MGPHVSSYLLITAFSTDMAINPLPVRGSVAGLLSEAARVVCVELHGKVFLAPEGPIYAGYISFSLSRIFDATAFFILGFRGCDTLPTCFENFDVAPYSKMFGDKCMNKFCAKNVFV